MRKSLLKLCLATVVTVSGAVGSSLTPIEQIVLNLPKQSIDAKERKDLLHMYEEEKLAYSVYKAMAQKYNLPLFKNISKSEKWHMHMVKLLMDKYDIKIPSEASTTKFRNNEIEALYKKLLQKGNKDMVSALKVGATIEDLDIYDLQKALARTDNEDIKTVYQNLEKGSRNHLRAFMRSLRVFGADYSPQYISQEYFASILSSSHERGPILPKNAKLSSGGKYVTPTANEIKGSVVKVYQLPGIKNKNVKWWMADVETKEGVVKVAIAPDWLVPEVHVSIGDYVEIEGFQGLYSFVSCEFEDKDSGFVYKSRIKRCK